MLTAPMPLDSLAGVDAGLGEFRVSAPREIAALLKQLCDGCVPLDLNADDGRAVTSTIWTLDASRGMLAFTADAADPITQALLDSTTVVVVGYLDSIKLQFDVRRLELVRGSRASALSCALPREMFRFQRRDSFRVRPLMRADPQARLRHAERPDRELALRVLDVSIGGCALFVPDEMPAIAAGAQLPNVVIELDADTRFHVNLQVQHVTAVNAEAGGKRAGCTFLQASGEALRALQRYIDLTQKRGRLLALD